MTNVRLKVCGMRETKNILSVASLRPDFMGFIFYPGTPRFVGEHFVLPHDLPEGIKRIGVFVNETTAEIVRKIERFRLDYVQLHGGEDAEQCGQLRDRGVGVIKVFSVDDRMDFATTSAYAKSVDYFLFDTKGKLYGGNAKRFNWGILSRYNQQIPFFLSGGITPDHIDEINSLSGLNLAAIDVNSGVEIRPGYKDISKIAAIKAMLNNNKSRQ